MLQLISDPLKVWKLIHHTIQDDSGKMSIYDSNTTFLLMQFKVSLSLTSCSITLLTHISFSNNLKKNNVKNSEYKVISINSYNIICLDLENRHYFRYLKLLSDHFLFLFIYWRLQFCSIMLFDTSFCICSFPEWNKTGSVVKVPRGKFKELVHK